MINMWFVLMGFVLVGVATANGQYFGDDGKFQESVLISEQSLVISGPSALPTVKGRLLTPQEGCGYSKVLTKRIVGGGPAKNGAYPWMALLKFNRTVFDSNDYVIGHQSSFECGKMQSILV